MSPRRKSGLSPEDLQALKHLPAVIRALENLQEQHAKVRALMGVGGHGIGVDFRAAHPMAGVDLLESVNRVQRSLDALPDLPQDPAGRLNLVMRWIGEGRISWQVGRRLLDHEGPLEEVEDLKAHGESKRSAISGTGLPPGDPERLAREYGMDGAALKSAILDTPERREYEAAKKAGKEVPPDLANISDAQRERMAEQKALVQQMRRAKGLPVAGEVEPVTEDQIVRTEELTTSESGSVGGEEDPEVH